MDIRQFDFRGNEVRVVVVNDTPMMVARDVALVLGYENPAEAVRDHCKKANKISQHSAGLPPVHMLVIPESDVYRLVMRSRLQRAEEFQDWVVEEVLPSIRKHGAYATPDTVEKMLADPDTMIQTLQALKAEREKREALEGQVEKDRPKVVFAESIEVSASTILVGELAKLIKQSTGCEVGQNRLFDWLRDNGYLHKTGSQRNLPTQRSIDAGWFVIKEGSRIDNSGEHRLTKTPKVTGKGQLYFINKFKREAAEAAA